MAFVSNLGGAYSEKTAVPRQRLYSLLQQSKQIQGSSIAVGFGVPYLKLDQGFPTPIVTGHAHGISHEQDGWPCTQPLTDSSSLSLRVYTVLHRICSADRVFKCMSQLGGFNRVHTVNAS